MTSREWKRFYAAERESLLPPTLDFYLDFDYPVFPEGGAVIFPHTRLMHSAEQIVPAVLSVLYSRARYVVALGPLHGGRSQDREIIQNARRGDATAIAQVRAIHSGEADIASDEFCLDNFEYLLQQFAKRLDLVPPQVSRRHPLLTVDNAAEMPGYRGIKRLLDQGAALLITADPIHHGVGYRTPMAECRSERDPQTIEWAASQIRLSLSLLEERNFSAFRDQAALLNSDFRDTGVLLPSLFPGGWTSELQSLSLVDYSDVLQCDRPTWVAAPLITLTPR